ncbi:MAG: hypothetical protein FWC89_04860 [Defluviitaleaceae bacterium]|nr:hypothetical protein [Defluviitaleaceae bacterium]
MTGHHIYTRSWYEYGSRTKNPGTFTVELTDGLFAPDTSDVIYHKLNPMLAGTQPSIAGYDLENSLLRVFHPTPDSTVVGRSYFVNDEITKRGVVQYSFGLVFSKEANDKFLKYPQRAFQLESFEPYNSFLKRVSEDTPPKYSAEFDPHPDDYQETKIFTREDWVNMGFDVSNFMKFFISLGKAIAPHKGEQKVAVLLPEGSNGEMLIHAMLTILPPWIVGKFGAVSRWTGATEDVNGIQLLCYAGEKPPHDTTSAVVDLTGESRHKNIDDITLEQQELAKWYWENIDKPDTIKTMTDYMFDKYKQLTDKMPFYAFAHCFWLWANFHVNNYDTKILTFEMSSRAINSLVSAFGKNLEKFFTNKLMLTSIFRVFMEQMDNVPTSKIHDATVRSICLLANSDFKVGDQIQARQFTKPLADRLFSNNEWQKLEPLMQYYAKVLKDGTDETKVAEAVELFALLLTGQDKKSADEAAAVLSNHANNSVAATFADGVNRVEEYKKIALLLKDAKRQMNLDITSWENVARNETASKAFFLLEKFNREKIANLSPPSAKQLDNILNGIQNLQQHDKTSALQNLLHLYWQSDALKDPAQMRKYVPYLHENKKLSLYLQNDVGTDDIRKIFIEEIDRTLDTREYISNDEKMEEIIKWLNVLRTDCGFSDSDPIFTHLGVKLSGLGDIGSLYKTMTPKAVKQLAETFTSLGSTGHAHILNCAVKFDETIGRQGNFAGIHKGWSVDYRYFLMRMEYWFNNTPNISVEWALSRAVYEAVVEKIELRQVAADMFLNYKNPQRTPKEDLTNLYEAMHILEDNHYERHITEEIYKSLRNKILVIINELGDTNSFETLFATASKFRSFAGRMSGQTNLTQLGKEISSWIKTNYTTTKPPYDILKKFNPNEREPFQYQSGGSTMLPDILTLSLAVAFLIAAISCVILIFSAYGLIATILATLPLWLIITAVVCGFLTLLITLFQILRPSY